MSMTTNNQTLRNNAESIIGILENIAGFEPSDIDGDSVELRFEDERGYDTGCVASIVEQCQKAADVVMALLGELEPAESGLAELNDALCKLLPGIQYMDPPDGGCVSPLEQVSRMVADYRERMEAAERRNAELEEKQRLIDICQGQGLEHRIAAEKRAEAAEKKLAKLIDILDWHTIELGWGEKPITLAELIVGREGADSLSTFCAAATDKGG